MNQFGHCILLKNIEPNDPDDSFHYGLLIKNNLGHVQLGGSLDMSASKDWLSSFNMPGPFEPAGSAAYGFVHFNQQKHLITLGHLSRLAHLIRLRNKNRLAHFI